MKSVIVGLILALLPLTDAMAQTVAQEKFSCDTPGGRFSRYQRPIPSEGIRLKTVTSVNDVRENGDWLPVVNVILNGGTVDSRLGLRLLPNRKSRKTTVFAVFPGMQGSQGMLLGEIDWKAKLSIDISASSSETIVSANGLTKTGPPVINPQWSLDLSCSSIDAHVDNIMLSEI